MEGLFLINFQSTYTSPIQALRHIHDAGTISEMCIKSQQIPMGFLTWIQKANINSMMVECNPVHFTYNTDLGSFVQLCIVLDRNL
jgi:hypothetical protein